MAQSKAEVTLVNQENITIGNMPDKIKWFSGLLQEIEKLSVNALQLPGLGDKAQIKRTRYEELVLYYQLTGGRSLCGF